MLSAALTVAEISKSKLVRNRCSGVLGAQRREPITKLSRGHDLAKAIQYILKRWPVFILFLDYGRVCFSKNAAERGLRGIAFGRKSWLFCDSDRGGHV